MKPRSLAVALLVALAPVTFAVPVWPQAPAEDATTGMARARFKEGVGFYDKGEFEQARASFLQAYALKQHPAVLLNLAWSCLKSGRVLEADKYFEDLLTEGKDLTDKQRADAADGLAQSRAKLGRIEVVATAGTDVTVDGEKAGIAPLPDAISVEAGAHTVKFKGTDGATETQSVTVLGGDLTTAHFGKVAAAIVAPEPAPTPPSDTTPTLPTPPPEVAQQPSAAPAMPAAETSRRRSPLAPPRNLVPAVVLGLVAGAGFTTAGILFAFRNEASRNASQVADAIVAGGGMISVTCTPQGLAQTPKFEQACKTYATDNDNVNSDATAGNVAIGVGLAATAGFIVYWLLADKGGSRASATTPIVAPLVGRSLRGLSMSADF